MTCPLLWGLACLALGSCETDQERRPRARAACPDAAVNHLVHDAAAPDAAEVRSHLAHNIIVVMGDGMGPEQVNAGRYVAGRLRMDSLAGPALVMTDSISTLRAGGEDPPATDSAAAATWFATGVRVEDSVLSLSPNGHPLTTVLELAKREGKATGLVTTSMFYDASPAAFAVHQTARDKVAEITHEMLGVTQPDVVMGSGSLWFDDPTSGLPQLVERVGYSVVRSVAALMAWDPVARPRLLGLFETDFMPLAMSADQFTMTPAIERRLNSPDPTLAMMTQRALARLTQDPDGFFLFAEDEITDEIGHRGPAEVEWARRALPAEVLQVDAALGVVLDWVAEHSSFAETLVVVLADHETGGYHFDHALGPDSADFSAAVEDPSTGLRGATHTRRPVEVRAAGPGSEAILQIASHGDTHRLLIGELR